MKFRLDFFRRWFWFIGCRFIIVIYIIYYVIMGNNINIIYWFRKREIFSIIVFSVKVYWKKIKWIMFLKVFKLISIKVDLLLLKYIFLRFIKIIIYKKCLF